MKINNTRRGFTLVELLVVILIISILAAVALPQYQKAIEKIRATQAIVWVRSLAVAQQHYFLIHGSYATQFKQLDIQLPIKNLNLAASTVNLPDFFISLNPPASDSTGYRVYAGRQRTYRNGRYYIVYVLKENKLYCAAFDTDATAIQLCKIVGTSPQKCPWKESAISCYPIK